MEQYHIYDLNKAYEDFVLRFGIEPNGVLMCEETYQLIKEAMSTPFVKLADGANITFRGVKIFRSQQLGINQLRFII